ncbi:multiple C2 and transmembrane domain-containing protein 1-like isoform X5 [Biomphalaria glabrata]|uniref:Multiple C2 and transmembrane domain-containing protein 1-like isoform X5 n=1 Tax=Biomphalaria glabrata TaxID=6526 RepID=A0A9W3A629_BIOGL|nr:multiple C2 and transmembrane domain-containing protein 1-like isoform X5 [Biomphalaria glabrata]
MFKQRFISRSLDHGTKRRSLKRHKSLSSSDTSGPPDDHHVMSADTVDSSSQPSPEPPPPAKTKHRIKLWNSFLNKTKHIRIRKKDKNQSMPPRLHRRSSSQPNIPISSRSSSASPSRVKDESSSHSHLPNGLDHCDGSTARRAVFRQQKELTRSESSLNDDSFTPKGRASKHRSGHRYGDSTEDDGYRSYIDNSTASAYRSLSDTALTPETEATLSLVDSYAEVGTIKSSNEMSMDKDEDEDNDGEDKENEEAEDDVPILIQSATLDPSVHSVSQQLSQSRSFFHINIHLKEGRDLVIRDSCGTSDPYVKFKIGNKVLYKSRTVFKNLNPKWDERFSIPVEDITKPINIKVFDYDRAWNDDPMGGVDLDITTLEVNKETDLKLLLTERGNSEYMGYLLLACSLVPKSQEPKEQGSKKSSLFRKSTRSTDSASTISKKIKMQLWNSVVNIVLVEGSNLVAMDDNGLSDPYVKFKLGTEKYRSKVKSKTLNPSWLEQFDLRLFDEQSSQLEISVYDHDTRGKDDFMGRAVIDLSKLEKEKTHTIVQPLEDGAGTVKLLLTISGTYGVEMASDLSNYTPNAINKDSIVNNYSLLNSFRNINDIGHLEVKVFRAHGLQAADFGGLSDPFCVLELVNDRVQTQTEYKTLNPEWSKVFTFHVRDIHSVLEITVYDEDRNKKIEFLGKVAIPLLKIRNGERRWYALKDRKIIHKTKGAILLEMDFIYNHVKAAIRTINPREEKLMLPESKFKISIMKQNINRVSQLIGVFMETGRFIQSCFDWQYPPRTIIAFIVYLVIVWNFELYMLPISLLLIFLKNLIVAQIVGSFRKEPVEDDYPADEEEDDDEEKDRQEEKKSIVDRYHAIQEICLQVQQGLDTVACLGERVKNTFNWSVPWLSSLAIIALSVGIIILYYIPLRYLLLAWGINKFTKKLRKPNAISNNELLDFLSRVPSDNELIQYRELRPDIPANTPSAKKKRS